MDLIVPSFGAITAIGISILGAFISVRNIIPKLKVYIWQEEH